MEFPKLRKYFSPLFRQNLRSFFVIIFNPIFRFSLSRLADLYGTDKSYKHGYTNHYELFFSKLRSKKMVLLEVGIGGYQNSELGGASLRMWKKYFNKSRIYGIDIYDKSGLDESRIKTFKCSQTDVKKLEEIISSIGKPHIVIDDGSHKNSDVIKSFKILFPLLKPGGFYSIEDVHTSYRNSFGGNSENLLSENTTMNYFKSLSDNVNQKSFDNDLLDIEKLKLSIKSIYFAKSLVILQKKSKI